MHLYRSLKYCLLSGIASAFMLFTHAGWAACVVDQNLGNATHFLVNGLINKPVPEAVFNISSERLGDGSIIPTTTVNNPGGSKTLTNHMRFRLNVKNKSRTPMAMIADSSAGLSCVDCASSVVIPFSKVSWAVGSAIETKGPQPVAAAFNAGQQTWITADPKQDSVFNLQFNFKNDAIYPAGTYKGTFLTRGVPQ